MRLSLLHSIIQSNEFATHAVKMYKGAEVLAPLTLEGSA